MFALKRTPPIKKLVQESVTQLHTWVCPPGCHVSISQVGTGADRYPQNESRNEYLSCCFHQRQKPDVGERWWAFCLMWKGFQWAVFVGGDLSEHCGQSKASCSLCSHWWSELTFAYPPESGDTNVLLSSTIKKKQFSSLLDCGKTLHLVVIPS